MTQMSRGTGIVTGSTPIYVEAVLEDGHGRLMIIPAQAIPTASIQQQLQPIQIQNATSIARPQADTSTNPGASNLAIRRSYQHENSVNSIQVGAGRSMPEQTELFSTTTSEQQVPNNIDITSIVQSIHIEPYMAKKAGRACMMNCGNNTSSKGSARLVTDGRCGHVVCLSCLMKAPNTCPLCQGNHDHVLQRNKVLSVKKEEFECPTCAKTFKRGSDLLRHERVCHGANNGSHACSVCKKNFSRAFDLKRHMLTHDKEKRFECSTCGAKFNRAENMKRHVQGHTGLKPFRCNFCDKEFSQQENLKRHVLSHTGDFQRYQCNECKKDFTRLASLRRHEHRHTGVWPYTCTDCVPPRGFSEKGLYKKHRLTHKGIKPYVCGSCNKGFNNPKAYRNHRRIHTGERPYVCSVCNGSFTQWGHLKRHKKVHEKQESMGKPLCRKTGGGWARRSDPSKPKLPLSAYFLWFMDARERILKANPHLNMPELAKAGGRLWKTINQEERDFYEKKAVGEREKYKKQLEEYTKKHNKNGREIKAKVVLIPENNIAVKKPDVVVNANTDAETDSPKISPGGFEGNLLESAGRSVGILPESFPRPAAAEGNIETPTNSYHNFPPDNFSRVAPTRTYSDFTTPRHPDVTTVGGSTARLPPPTNITIPTFSVPRTHSNGNPNVTMATHSNSNTHVTMATSHQAGHFEPNFTRYQGNQEYSTTEYSFANSPTHILDFNNRSEANPAGTG